MRVLHVLPSLSQSYGGPIRAVLDLSAQARRHGLESEVVGLGSLSVPDNPLPAELIHSVAAAGLARYGYAPRLRSWLRQHLPRFDGAVIHGMWLYPNHVTSQECVRAGIPYACFPHGMLEPWAIFHQSPLKAAKKVVYWYLREANIFRHARCVYFTTERERRLAEETFHLDRAHRILIPYGVDVEAGPRTGPANPALLQPEERKVALFLGRLHPKKNAHFLIDAWYGARPPPAWHLVIAGSGEEAYTASLRQKIAALRLQDTVHLVGFVAGADKSYLLRRAAWFLLPSSQENFGIAVLEAMSHGCPVAISDQVFLADSLHSESEVLPLDIEAWIAFFRHRMGDDAHRDHLVELDQKHLVNELSIAKVSRDWAETLTETLAFKPLAPTVPAP